MAEVFDIHQQWEDSFGGLLVGGQVFYGKPNTDPTILGNRIGVFADRELSIDLPNPQTIGPDGRVENKPWLGERYSIEVYDGDPEIDGVLQYSSPDNGSNPTPGGVNISLSNVIGINDLTAESPDGILEYVDQQKFTFEAVATNTDKMTLDVDGRGAKSIKFNFAEEIKPGFIQNGQMVNVIYSAEEDNFSWTNAGRGISLLTDVAGSANAITANGGPSKTAYVDKQVYSFKAVATTTGNVTLKIGARPTHSIKSQGAEIPAGGILINNVYQVVYNSTGTVFELTGDFTGPLLKPLDTNGFPINTSRSTVASSPTTSDIWANAIGNEIDFTGTATVTTFPNAPRAGASRILHCAAACTFTNNANLAVMGAETFNAVAGDVVHVHAITTSTFRLTILKADGRAVVSSELRDQVDVTGLSSVPFNEIPANARQIIVMFAAVKTSGTQQIKLQLGDSGGIESTVYLGASVRLQQASPVSVLDSVIGFTIGTNNSNDAFSGELYLNNSTGNEWTSSHSGHLQTGAVCSGGGVKTLSDTLTQIQISPTSGVFGSGGISIRIVI